MGSLSWAHRWRQAKPYVAVILLRTALAGMVLLGKHALNKGLNHYTFVVYRLILAAIVFAPSALVFERKQRPKMTIRIFAQILLLAVLEPVMDQNLYYIGMQYTTATLAASLGNILPALTFVIAWIFRLEKVNIWKIRSQSKIVGTLVSIGGAMVMTLIKGPIIPTPWNNSGTVNNAGGSSSQSSTAENPVKGALIITAGNICWTFYCILQAVTIKSYPAELSLTALMCFLGAVVGLALTLVMEWGNSSIWSLSLDSKLLAIVYGGVVCSGMVYYLQAMITRTKGPVFLAASNPLTMVIVAIISSFFLSETLSLGSLVGQIVIAIGLYLFIWGKGKEAAAESTFGSTNQPIILSHVVESPEALSSSSTTDHKKMAAKENNSGDGSNTTTVDISALNYAKNNESAV